MDGEVVHRRPARRENRAARLRASCNQAAAWPSSLRVRNSTGGTAAAMAPRFFSGRDKQLAAWRPARNRQARRAYSRC